jgi:hypothetical protein
MVSVQPVHMALLPGLGLNERSLPENTLLFSGTRKEYKRPPESLAGCDMPSIRSRSIGYGRHMAKAKVGGAEK